MNKILYFLMVGFAFTVLQVGTAEAVKDCAGFTPGTPSFQSCVDANAKAALNNNEGNQSGGDAGAGAMQNNSGTATPTGAPGAAATGDPAVKPSLVDRFKGILGLGAIDDAPPTEAPGTTGMGAPGTTGTDCVNAGDPTEVAACWDRQAPSAEATGMGAPGTASTGDPSCAPLANGTLPPHCK